MHLEQGQLFFMRCLACSPVAKDQYISPYHHSEHNQKPERTTAIPVASLEQVSTKISSQQASITCLNAIPTTSKPVQHKLVLVVYAPSIWTKNGFPFFSSLARRCRCIPPYAAGKSTKGAPMSERSPARKHLARFTECSASSSVRRF